MLDYLSYVWRLPPTAFGNSNFVFDFCKLECIITYPLQCLPKLFYALHSLKYAHSIQRGDKTIPRP